MASRFYSALIGRVFGTAADTAVQTGVNGEAQPRFQIDAGGTHRWGDGTSATDVTLARSAADTLTLGAGDSLTVPGTLKGNAAVQAGTTPTATGVILDGSVSGEPSIKVNYNDLATNSVAVVEQLNRRTGSTPALGIGVAQEMWVETAANNDELGLRIGAVSTDVGAGTEDFDVTFETTIAGTAGEVFRMSSDRSFRLPAIVAEPPTPPANTLKVYAKNIGGRMMLKQVGPSGIDTPFQQHLGFNGVVLVKPNATTTVTALGGTHGSTGTISTPAIVGTSILGAARKYQIASAGTAGSAAESRITAGHVIRGSVSGAGGWFGVWRINLVAAPATSVAFVGLQSSTGALAGVVTPSALLDMCGIGYDSGDTNWQFMRNDGAGTAPKLDLGADFPVRNTSHFIELVMFCPPNGGEIFYRVSRLDNAAINPVSNSVTTDLPTNTVPLCSRYYTSNGSTASAATFQTTGHFVESDF